MAPNAENPSAKTLPTRGKDEQTNADASQALDKAFIDYRIAIFDRIKAEYDEKVSKLPHEPITITVKHGDEKEQTILNGTSWETTPASLLKQLPKDISDGSFIAKVNDEQLWDFGRPLEATCTVRYLKFDDDEGKKVFWHSSAHVLGEAAELKFACHLCNGPPTEDGFYYDLANPSGQPVVKSDHDSLQKLAAGVIKEKQRFERLMMTKEQLLEMFNYNKYKVHFISEKIPDGTSSTVYRCGTLIDLCLGPHVPHTGAIKTFEVTKNSSSYFLGDAANDSLQRIYGISFPDKKGMTEWKKFVEEAAKRDHRKIGVDQELVFFDDVSPGSAFFQPNGTIIYNALQKLLRQEYWKRGYQEVITPNMYNTKLWKTSGHLQHYQENMFVFDVEKEEFALKPMNCPGHCELFRHRERSYRELPWRVADFGVLHRNEASGALTGLTRVRRFQQDDTHIFCTTDQVTSEIEGLFDFLKHIYGLFGFTFKLKLSTRPEKFLGDIETWRVAEEKLTLALNSFSATNGTKWELNPGDGAFYGPKIDITISDALRRDFQCATIQLDFQLPQNFGLEYMTAEGAQQIKDAKAAGKTDGLANAEADSKPASKAPSPGYARPVMIHRAIFGSFERFFAILTEHFGGKWPFWLSPRQILIIPVMPAVNDYVEELQRIFRSKKMHVDIDVSGNTMKKKILTGQLKQYNFIFVVGEQEKNQRAVNIRNRDDPSSQVKGEMISIEDALTKLTALRKERRLVNAL
ncbi:threonyl-tRNA synthetase [Xylona heveae TC161]|uniref:threonine--tRNA ligase n=1 Tax=Xylona heveae (strain CBS 132557 / TC161) TaxID=1328760 RepID=A0A165GA81_XYLHT|nr:threonyl-tRNA synthetase [Xylona heveae TC161]KZF21941.1 threonyl-tRNA synthetase [Xylona heveae TC161]